MFPLFWNVSPQFFLPWSGSVRQDIELDRFFSAIPRSAGDGGVEEAAFKRASYGSQLGWITEVLLETMKDVPADEKSALGKLRLANADIQRLKLQRRYPAPAELSGELIADYLRTLRQQDSARYEAESRQLLQLLQPSQPLQPLQPVAGTVPATVAQGA
ncbi:hypothetical protein ASC94_20065 [Massilia sp. Root418]|uniref:hypothetical protein n=1 Tax=Massilia sp. Root418 TaxID=1736532 RepID=UPI0006F3765B|nr:hypothetical protein [Massilia sp. Root418]KQW90046.1 hypothetical protein ASC94_20065 [Massilia sp. Root418]